MGTIDSLVGRAVVLVITVLGVIALLPGVAHPKTITEIIDSTGDGSGNTLSNAPGVAVDGSGNVYVTGRDSHNAFQIEKSRCRSDPG